MLIALKSKSAEMNNIYSLLKAINNWIYDLRFEEINILYTAYSLFGISHSHITGKSVPVLLWRTAKDRDNHSAPTFWN